MHRTIRTICMVALVVTTIAACNGAADGGGAKAGVDPAPTAGAATAPATAAADASRLAGKWMSDAGQFTEYVLEDGKLYVMLGSEKNECTLDGGRISYRSAGMTVRMNYRFLDDDTVEYTDPSMPNWNLTQKRQ